MVNVENIQAVINFIKNEDMRLDMEYIVNGKNWWFEAGEVTCGSPMCIAGTCVFLSGGDFDAENGVVGFVTEFLGINYSDFQKLCEPWETTEYLSYQDFSELEKYICGRPVKVFSKEGVIHTLEHLRDTGKVCWFVNIDDQMIYRRSKMGTRATYRFFDNNNHLISLYGQYDGYPSGNPLGIVKFLNNLNIVNGLYYGSRIGECANGWEDAILQLIVYLKREPGNWYLETTPDEAPWLDYNWIIDVSKRTISWKEYDLDEDGNALVKSEKVTLKMTFEEFIETYSN